MIKSKLVTPELARQWLQKNQSNRPLRTQWISHLAQQMQNGSWMEETGETIKFDKKGNLIDGQHRLSAIVLSKKSMRLEIKEGLERKAMEVIDTGKSRSSSDLLAMAGYNNTVKQASTARFVILFNLGRYSDSTSSGSSAKSNRGINVSNSDILRFVKENEEDISKMINYAQNVYANFRYMPTSLLAGIYFVFSKIHKGKTQEFFESLVSGANLKSDSPIYFLRERLLKDSTAKRKMNLREKLALIIIAWNYFRENKSIGALVYTKNMSFPKPK